MIEYDFVLIKTTYLLRTITDISRFFLTWFNAVVFSPLGGAAGDYICIFWMATPTLYLSCPVSDIMKFFSRKLRHGVFCSRGHCK